MGLFGGIASAVGGIASTILGNNSAKHEAEKNRQWQEEMSNTSIQRRMADLKAAGLNPLLAVESASSGASTPTGGQANLKHYDPTSIATLMNGVANARLVNAQAKAQENDNSVFGVKADGMRIQNELMKQGVWTAEVERDLKLAQTDAERAKILTEAYKRENLKVNTEKINKEAMILGIDYNLLKNGPNSDYVGANAKFNADNSRGFVQSIAYALGLNSAKSIEDKGFKKNYNISKKYIPRNINERRISR